MANAGADIAVTPRSDKLSFWSKAAYAIGGLGDSAGPGTIIPFWYSILLIDIARLHLRLVSLFWLVVTIAGTQGEPGLLPGRSSERSACDLPSVERGWLLSPDRPRRSRSRTGAPDGARCDRSTAIAHLVEPVKR
jgi:hypothetical protein